MPNNGKVAIVTGAARPWGLGRATAMMLAEKGYNIAVADLRDDWAQEAVKSIQGETGRKAVYVKTDISKPASSRAMADQVVKQLGRIDALCNVAGIVRQERLDQIKEETLDAILNINLKGTIFNCQAVLPHMRKVGGGRIVNVASGSAVQPLKGQSAYAASKAGVVIFSKILAWEVARDNIAVVTVAPGNMNTNMGGEAGPSQNDEERASRATPFLRAMSPKDVAEVIVFAVTSTHPALHGQTLHANAGAYMV